MIDPKELRIGNIINQGRYGAMPITAYQLYRYSHYKKTGYGAEYYHNWTPIPLTEQWLIDFGFEKKNSNTYAFQPNKLERIAN